MPSGRSQGAGLVSAPDQVSIFASMTQPPCVIGSGTRRCQGVLVRKEAPVRYACSACGRLFGQHDFELAVRAYARRLEQQGAAS